MSSPTAKSPGVVRNDESYTVHEFRLRVGFGDYAMRQARKAGLRTIAVGRNIYVRGCDWLKFLDQQSDDDKPDDDDDPDAADEDDSGDGESKEGEPCE